MENPCLSCATVGVAGDKNCEACRNCKDRLAYVEWIDGSVPGETFNRSVTIMEQEKVKKICHICGEEKKLTQFYSPDSNICRICRRKQNLLEPPATHINGPTENRTVGGGPRLEVDFTGYEYLYDELVKSAERGFRDLNSHVLAAIDFLIFMETDNRLVRPQAPAPK